MRFSFFMTMHHEVGQESLKDVVGILGKQLRALGHEAVLDPKNATVDTAFVIHGPDDVNVVVEGFTPGWVQFMERVRQMQPVRFVILATEEPTPKGFNWGLDPEMVRRQEIFPEAAKHCDGILHLVPGQHVADWYGRLAPTACAELGYAPDLVRPQGPEPEFDFGFYGSSTPRREKIIKRLEKMTGKRVITVRDFKSQEVRDREMRRARVILQIRKFDEMGLVSSSRCNTALCLGRPVIAEPHELSKPWDEVVDFATSMEDFYARAMVARSIWRQLHAAQMARFKAKMTPEFCVGGPLRRIGIIKDAAPTVVLPSLRAMEDAKLRRRRLLYG